MTSPNLNLNEPFSSIDIFNNLTSSEEVPLFEEFNSEEVNESKGFTLINPDGSFYDPSKDDLSDDNFDLNYNGLGADLENSYTIRAAGVLVFSKSNPGYYLAIRKPRPDQDPSISLPCGKLDETETYLWAALRELAEETGLVLDSEDLSSIRYFSSTYSIPGTGATYNYHTYMFAAEVPNFTSFTFVDSQEGEVVLVTEEQLTSPETSIYAEYNKNMFKFFREMKLIGAE